jgi:hypothetical protein
MVATGKSAEVDGAAASMGKHKKEEEYRRAIHGGAYDWQTVVMESGGRLGKGEMRVISRLAKTAAESGDDETHKLVCAAYARGAERGVRAGEWLHVQERKQWHIGVVGTSRGIRPAH